VLTREAEFVRHDDGIDEFKSFCNGMFIVDHPLLSSCSGAATVVCLLCSSCSYYGFKFICSCHGFKLLLEFLGRHENSSAATVVC
jgi:hypothetical protein